MPKWVRDLMKAGVVTISPGAPAPEIHRLFLRARVGALPVVGTDGRLEGIVLVGILSAFDFVILYAEQMREESIREESVDAR